MWLVLVQRERHEPEKSAKDRWRQARSLFVGTRRQLTQKTVKAKRIRSSDPDLKQAGFPHPITSSP
jgi:hypothetical protein